MTPLHTLTELYTWAAGGLATMLAGVGGIVKQNRERSKRNARQLRGDPDDPNAEGVLEIAHDTQTRLQRIEDKLDDICQHLDDDG